MKKKFFSLLVAVLSIATNLWALDAPTMPKFVAPESGGTYYLYNVESGLWMTTPANSTSYVGVGTNALPVLVTLESNGAYSMKFTTWTYGYIHSYDQTYARTNSYSSLNSYCYWSITNDGDIYNIQRSPKNTGYYEAEEYLGWVGETSDYVYANKALGENTSWKFAAVTDASTHYFAELALYEALKPMEAFAEAGLIDNYLTMYANRATTSDEDLYDASKNLINGHGMSSGYIAPWWNENPIFFATPDGSFGDSYWSTWTLPNNSYTSGGYFRRYLYDGETSSLSATVNVDETSTFVYSTGGDYSNVKLEVYVDGTKVRTLQNEQMAYGSDIYRRFFEILEPGKHTITWVANCNASSSSCEDFQIQNIGVLKSSQQITVSLLEPGSLGTEVLYQTDHIKNVRSLKVKGTMNDDDWAKIHMMSNLLELDLSEAKFTEIPTKQFDCYNDTTMRFLHVLKLPEGLKKINDYAFYYSLVEHLDFPSTVESVGLYAFNSSHLKELILPDNLTGFYNGYGYTFCHMYWLEKLVCPKNLTVIPKSTFESNYFCKEIVLPEKLETIEEYAFYCNKYIQVTFPEGLKTIGERAFYGCTYGEYSAFPESLTSIGAYAFWNNNHINHLVIPKNVTSIGYNAFEYCYYITDAELGVNQYSLSSSIFQGCSRLKTLKLNSATVAKYNTNSSYYPLNAEYINDVTLIVPQFLVNSYKLDAYWYNFKSIEGFETDDVDYWAIKSPLTLNRERFGGKPSINISAGAYLKVNGETEQQFNDVTINRNSVSYDGAQLLSNCKKLTINGDVTLRYYTSANKWYFISLPFDVKVSDIVVETEGAKNAIRYYDGANRATFGPTGSWKKFEADAVIPAGTGFIYQTSKDTWSGFKAVDNDMKQNIVSVNEFSRDLDVNASEVASNAGWNLVGNPYQCYYNTHKLNFTAPITVWNVSNRTYSAYSITDDDYALAPNEAFFVQCDAGYPTIGFPIDGRQLDNIIVEQNAVKDRMATASSRQFIDLTFTDGQTTDQTRIVINPVAKMDYETSYDAGKFMSMDTDVPQIYTLGADGVQYAINERPLGNAEVGLGLYAGKTGTYTLALKRSTAGQVYLKDNESGEVTEITDLGVKVSVEAGTSEGRFSLVFAGSATGIEGLVSEPVEVQPSVFNLNGQAVSGSYKGIVISNGKKILKK